MVHWRNFHGQVDMPLAPRMFLLSPNASGKSNVLDALRFLRDTADQGLQAAISSRGGMGATKTSQPNGSTPCRFATTPKSTYPKWWRKA
ncbi:MAG: AAA family ATPase [Synechococcus sp. SB0675_bin_6]|nr:AAA family ATPase [Synechococcus sp. SB0675_bin_6]